MRPSPRVAVVLLSLVALGTSIAARQAAPPFSVALRHPAIDYSRRPPNDPVADLGRKLESGVVSLRFDERTGYLPSVLEALGIPIASQVLVLSKTSFQRALIGPNNPRALYFNDHASVGWVRGGEVLELAGQDPEQGTMFYTIAQKPEGPPRVVRNDSCLSCHLTTATLEVPGIFVASLYPAPDGLPMYAPVFESDHRSPLDQRWGGWYVTGSHGRARHMGNGVVTNAADIASLVADRNQNLDTLEGRVDLTGYLTPHSDIVALMVLEHQARMTNLFTRVAWEARIDTPEARALVAKQPNAAPPPDRRFITATRPAPGATAAIKTRPFSESVKELVDYLLFVDEARLVSPVRGTSDFAAVFQRQGPWDGRGRSLRDLALDVRLLKYPCSFMIYSPAFDRLPPNVRDAVYRRMWDVLSGVERGSAYRRALSLDDRRTIVEILRETKPGLPAYFRPVTE